LGNFVFPSTPLSHEHDKQASNFCGITTVFINLVMLLFISIESLDFINALYLIPVNVYVTIFGVVFATGELAAPWDLGYRLQLTYGQCGALHTSVPRL
jgi:hypothetical protein